MKRNDTPEENEKPFFITGLPYILIALFFFFGPLAVDPIAVWEILKKDPFYFYKIGFEFLLIAVGVFLFLYLFFVIVFLLTEKIPKTIYHFLKKLNNFKK